MSSTNQLRQINNSVKTLLQQKLFTHAEAKPALKKAKIAIYSNPNFQKQSEEYLHEAVRFAELNLMQVLGSRAERQYQSAINIVKFFYQNTLIPHKPLYHSMMVAIHLLFLLSNNRNQEFYTKLESIKTQDLLDQFISYVLLINDAIEEGNYTRVFLLKHQNPLPDFFSPFLDQILSTVRTEIAKSAEKAYSHLSIKQALNIFQFTSQNQLRQFVNKYHENLQQIQVQWIFQNDKIIFEKGNNNKINFNSQELIKTSLKYAVQLERIA